MAAAFLLDRARLLLVLLASSTIHDVAAAPSMMRREPKQTQLQSGPSLQTVLKEVIGSVPASRLLEIEASVRPTYEVFPKNAQGQLPPSEIVPAIVRSYFAKEHGWLIKGLEPPLTKAMPAEVQAASVLKDRAPALVAALQGVVKANRGVSLSDVVGLVAALEKLILDDAANLLEGVYGLHQLPTTEKVDMDQLHQLLQSYILLFRNGVPRNLNNTAAHQRLVARAQESQGWQELVSFEKEVVDSVRPDGLYTFEDATNLARDMVRRFGKWQNSECVDMKSTLTNLTQAGPGRVAFSVFHSEPNHAVFQFTETEEYLQKIGATDVAPNGGETEVLIANYLLGPSNCIATSEYFSVCCLNECEQLLSQLEARAQAPALPAAKLLALVAELGADAADAAAAEALAEIGRRDGGLVTLHSAEFKLWLHRAFPNECPLPTAFERAAEELERASAVNWLDLSQECTRVPEWHPTLFPETSAETPGAAGGSNEEHGSVVRV